MVTIRVGQSERRSKDYPETWSAPVWLEIIRACNAVNPGMFGRPDELKEWWAGGSVEEYPDARVIHNASNDGTTRIVSKTEEGEAALRTVAEQFGIHVPN